MGDWGTLGFEVVVAFGWGLWAISVVEIRVGITWL